MSVEELQSTLEEQVRKTHSEAERKLMPAPLLRERDFYGRVWFLVGLVYSVPWLYFGFRSFTDLHDGPLWDNWSFVWRMAVAVFLAWYHARSARHARGLYYPLDIWEQSIARRREEWRSQHPDKSAVLDRLQNQISKLLVFCFCAPFPSVPAMASALKSDGNPSDRDRC